ncbi:MAG: DUF2497 domain-containing protein [Altererythrobacter sp.]|nr:DUF2497 domain-containing protein [Altererythrobacter sp.]
MQQPGEPSVEEILESIKKVIARENAPVGVPVRRRPASTLAAELNERVQPAATDEADEVLELDESAAVALTEHEDAAESRYDEAQAAEDAAPPLTAETTAAAMRENLSALAMLAQPGRQPQIVRSGETSLEGLTRELLRPMLAKWLDENLPPMVEELVKAEIARIAGKKG